ncbi:MAG TPA: hypothetical protein VNJ06_02890, partial [Gemmatimonadales bacterium]|nr:hypothetical protein [Gemmatimonadales bacterium]
PVTQGFCVLRSTAEMSSRGRSLPTLTPLRHDGRYSGSACSPKSHVWSPNLRGLYHVSIEFRHTVLG